MNTTKIINYKNYGKCLELNNGNIKCYITLDIGPRIIYYGKDQNLLFEDINDDINKKRDDLQIENNSWHIYGGHRIWKSPENDRTYYPDNNKCDYKIENNYHVIKSNQELDTKIQKELWVKLNDDNSLDIKNIINKDDSSPEKNIATWSLTVLKPNGTIIIPLNQKDTGYLPNRSINLWSYTNFNDKRLDINDKRILVNIEKEEVANKNPMKIGTYSDEKKVFYLKNDCVIEFQTKANDKNNYPDYNSNIEVYTQSKMVEVEFLTSYNEKVKQIILEEKWIYHEKDSDIYSKVKNMK